MGITTLAQLDEIVPKDLLDSEVKYGGYEENNNFLGILRDIMIIYDAKKYYENAWRNSWHGILFNELLNKYGVPVADLFEKYERNTKDEDYDEED